ncbi:MAG: 1-acyl-sn-glycerol-3-phosphate acyltransferase [Myxococcales bacterium]
MWIVESSAAQERPAALERELGPFARAFADRYFAPIPFPEDGARLLARLSKEGEVVHVMRSAGMLSFLYLAWAVLTRGLPPLRAATGLRWSFWSPFRRLFRRGSAAQRLERALNTGNSALVFLRQASGWIPRFKPSEDPFHALVARARKASRPLFLVPELFLWHSRARNLRPGIRDFLFGSPEDPKRFVTAYGFLRNYRTAFFRVSKPIDLTAFVRENADLSDAALVRMVRGSLFQHLARETRAIVGPPRKSPGRIIEETMRDRSLRASLEQVAAERQVELEAVRREARRYLAEIASRYSTTVIAILVPILRWVFNRIYSKVEIDERGLSRALETAREAPLIFCPSHKSHLDYLLMSWMLGERGIMPPLVAAGANLSFWPLGPILRRAGAYFLRRSFKGNKVYAASFKAYVKKLLREGYTQEFFIEGGRSRTGKLLSPKLGMINFEVSAFLERAQDDVYFVPVSLDYEKVVEANSYARELAGADKKPESIRSLLAAPKVLTARYGHIHISFDEPISLRAFLSARVGGDLEKLDGEARRSAVRALAQRITYGISQATTITPAALLAAALLAHRRRGTTAREASRRIQQLHEIARREGARLSPVLADAPSDPSTLGPINEIARMFMEDGLVQAQVVGEETIYTVPDEKRPALCFYKNNLVHVALGRTFTATALLSIGDEAPLDALLERLHFLTRLLKLEFSFQVGVGFDAIVERAIEALVADGLIARDGDRIRVAEAPNARSDLGFLRDLMRELLESYRLLASSLQLAQQPAARKDLVKAALERGRAEFLSGSIACYEALAKPTLETAVAAFVDWGVLEQSEDEKTVSLTDAYRSPEVTDSLADQIERFLG